jgi:hypothetical protein
LLRRVSVLPLQPVVDKAVEIIQRFLIIHYDLGAETTTYGSGGTPFFLLGVILYSVCCNMTKALHSEERLSVFNTLNRCVSAQGLSQ